MSWSIFIKESELLSDKLPHSPGVASEWQACCSSVLSPKLHGLFRCSRYRQGWFLVRRRGCGAKQEWGRQDLINRCWLIEPIALHSFWSGEFSADVNFDFRVLDQQGLSPAVGLVRNDGELWSSDDFSVFECSNALFCSATWLFRESRSGRLAAAVVAVLCQGSRYL